MNVDGLLADAFERINEGVHAVADGLSQEELEARPGPKANTIEWLVWHIARVQDDHVSDLAGREQVWLSQGFADRFHLPLDAHDTGYGNTTKEVGRVRGVPAGDLLAYCDAVHEQTLDVLGGLTTAELDRVVDTQWDPPVTLAVRLVSVIADNLQHVGQAAYVRGLLRQG
jgi:uncharacterized damage-inducible protein DinB